MSLRAYFIFFFLTSWEYPCRDQSTVEYSAACALTHLMGLPEDHVGLLHLNKIVIEKLFPGSESCDRLLSSGEYRGNYEWQATGCMMHKYSHK